MSNASPVMLLWIWQRLPVAASINFYECNFITSSNKSLFSSINFSFPTTAAGLFCKILWISLAAVLWSFKELFLIAVACNLRVQPFRAAKAGDSIRVSLSVLFPVCQHGNSIHSAPPFAIQFSGFQYIETQTYFKRFGTNGAIMARKSRFKSLPGFAPMWYNGAEPYGVV